MCHASATRAIYDEHVTVYTHVGLDARRVERLLARNRLSLSVSVPYSILPLSRLPSQHSGTHNLKRNDPHI